MFLHTVIAANERLGKGQVLREEPTVKTGKSPKFRG
jgi:hypothetical protein